MVSASFALASMESSFLSTRLPHAASANIEARARVKTEMPMRRSFVRLGDVVITRNQPSPPTPAPQLPPHSPSHPPPSPAPHPAQRSPDIPRPLSAETPPPHSQTALRPKPR